MLINYLIRVVTCASLVLFASISWATTATGDVDFVKDIKPIFEFHCVHCHGPEKAEGFRIDVRDDALIYVDTDSIDDSDLYQVLISDDEETLMPPPDEGTPLTANQISLVKTWIEEGAEWPDGVTLVDTSQDAAPADTDDPATGSDPPDPANQLGNQQDKTAQDNPAKDKPASKPGDDKAPAQVSPKTQQIFNAIGSLHPAAVHLPIGLLLAAGLFALFSLRGNFVMSDCAYYCLWLGTIGAIVACASGWWFSPMEKRGTVTVLADLWDQTQPVFWHRTGALIITAVAFLLALFAAGARNRDPDDGVMWKLGLILLAGGIGWVGHTGGELHYPSDHYKDLNGLWNSVVNPNAEDEIEKGKNAQPNGLPPVSDDLKDADPANVTDATPLNVNASTADQDAGNDDKRKPRSSSDEISAIGKSSDEK